MSNAPVVLFTYNRPDHTRQTVDALRQNIGAGETDLHIYSDGPKKSSDAEAVRQLRSYLRTIEGFRSVAIVERERNMGLAASVIAGVTAMLESQPSVIVVEDDMLTSPNFLTFMNEALRVYEKRQDIFSVTGYNYPLPISDDYPQDAYLSYRGSSWGWGTWADRWRKVDWAMADFADFLGRPDEMALFARGGDDLLPMLKLQMSGKLDSWSIRFDYAHYKNNAFCLHAVRSKVQNIGFDGSGIHCNSPDGYAVDLDSGERAFGLPPGLQTDLEILAMFDARFRPPPTVGPRPTALSATISFLKRAARKILRSLGIRKSSW